MVDVIIQIASPLTFLTCIPGGDWTSDPDSESVKDKPIEVHVILIIHFLLQCFFHCSVGVWQFPSMMAF